MRLLAVDTATEICGVALCVDGDVQVELTMAHGQTHARFLMAGIENVLALAEMDLAAVDAFAVTRGPGSFTGLRIGISTVKGLALGTGKPLVGVSSLAALAHQVGGISERVCPMVDARRGEVYWSLFRRQGTELVCQLPEQVGTACAVADHIDGPCFFVGSGALLYETDLRAHLRHDARWAPAQLHALRPAVVARLGWQQLAQGCRDDAQTLAPLYLRKSDAERSRRRDGPV